MDFKDYYATLGVTKTASDKDIKQAFRKLARKYHPDVNPGDKAAEARFKEINEAYEVLGDPASRKKYDELGANWRMYEQAQAHGGGQLSDGQADGVGRGRILTNQGCKQATEQAGQHEGQCTHPCGRQWRAQHVVGDACCLGAVGLAGDANAGVPPHYSATRRRPVQWPSRRTGGTLSKGTPAEMGSK